MCKILIEPIDPLEERALTSNSICLNIEIRLQRKAMLDITVHRHLIRDIGCTEDFLRLMPLRRWE